MCAWLVVLFHIIKTIAERANNIRIKSHAGTETRFYHKKLLEVLFVLSQEISSNQH